ncbi:MAG: hypothetical protein LBU89_07235 [Fibromonadaceae bacterium]|jgi:hypothetical protein|nr:hypothetical protein [Fibromonadaceae bacterium]
MFHYKSVKHKSNYVSVKVPAGADYEYVDSVGEKLVMQQKEQTLVFSLFEGEHVAKARCVVGKIGEDVLVGETVVHYAYEGGRIKVCAYDYSKTEEERGYEAPPHYTRPLFNLYRLNSQNDALMEQQPLFIVYSEDTTPLVYNSPLLNVVLPIKNHLRTVYDRICEILKGTGVTLSSHVDDIVLRDNYTNEINGKAVKIITPFSGYFYNLVGSSSGYSPASFRYEPADEPLDSSKTWLPYYKEKVSLNRTPLHPIHNYCASSGKNHLCDSTYVGGHVLIETMGISHMTLILSAFFSCYSYIGWISQMNCTMPIETVNFEGYSRNRYVPSGSYCMLPICNRANGSGRGLTMHTRIMMGNYFFEDLLELKYFKFGFEWTT